MKSSDDQMIQVIRYLLICLTVILAIAAAGGIAYGGGFKNVYITYASLQAYAATALLLLSVYGVWLIRNR